MLPSQGRQMGEKVIGHRGGGLQGGNGTLKVAGVPQDDGGNHQIQPGRAVLLVLVGAVADFAETMDEDGAGEAVAGFALVQLLAGLPAECRILQPVEGEQRAFQPPQLAQGQRRGRSVAGRRRAAAG